MRSCAVCFFFRPDGDRQGDCMVDPPVPILTQLSDETGQLEATFTSVRPLVGEQDFCGRFSHRNGAVPRPD